ncbi:MAG: CARDB domain-containing protein, partial [Phycisphaerales bacterium]
MSHVVRNAGNGAASGTWVDRVHLSADAVLDPADIALGDVAVTGPALSSTEYSRTSQLPIPASTPPGEYHLILSTDATNAVSEPGNEGNNVIAGVQRVRIAALPNLGLASAPSAPAGAGAGDVIRVGFTVRNDSSAAATGSWNDAVYLSADTTLQVGVDVRVAAAVSPASLAAGATYERALDVTLPADFSPAGTRHLIVAVDDNAAVDEATEADNIVVRAITISPTPVPDLAVSNVTSPATGSFGSPLSLGWTVANQGEIAAVGAWSDAAVLSLNDTFGDADDIALSPTVPGATPLPVSQSYQRSGVSFTVPARHMPQATYRVLVRTGDPANVSPREAARANNVGVGPEIVMTPTPSPNLRVTEVVAPSTALAGAGVTLRWTVSNAGTAAASGLWTDRVLLRDPSGVSPDVELGIFGKSATVAPGQSYTQQFAVTLPREVEGSRVFVVMTDSGNAIAEPAPGAEADNTAVSVPATAVDLPQGPDLVVAAVEPLGGSGTFGVPVSVRVTVRNQGTLAATGAWFDRVLLRREGASASEDLPLEPLSPAPAGPLAPGGEYVVTAVVTPPVRNEFADGAYRFVARADANGNVAERREGNNELVSAPFTLVRPVLPNLRVNFISVPDPALPGGAITVTWTVVNAGGARVQGSWAERLFVSSDASVGNDTLLSTISVEETLEPGQVSAPRSRTVPALSAGLSYRMVVCADVGGVVVEQSESDNCAVSIADSVIERSDLTVRGMAAVPLNVMADDMITVSWTGENIGAASTSGTFVDVVSLVDVVSGVRHVLGSRVQSASMAPGVPEQRIETFDVPGRIDGEFRVEVSTDVANAIVESIESNNTASGAFEVSVTQPLRPNLVVSAVQPPASGVVGSMQTVGFTVANTASVGAAGPWLDRVVARNVATGVEQELAIVPRSSALAAGASYSQSVTVRLPQTVGDYVLCVSTDSGDTVNEGLAGGEADNRRCAEAVFRAQTYIVTAVPSVAEGVAGTPVTVTGVATSTSGGEAIPNLPVSLSVSVRGTVRTYADPVGLRTDANGAYSFLLPLLESEAGQYALRAGPPGNVDPTVRGSFVLHGLRATPTLSVGRVAPGAAPVVRQVTVTNTGDLPLTGLAMTVAEAPPGLMVVGIPSGEPLLGQQSRTFDVAFSAAAEASPASGTWRLRFTTAQGAAGESTGNVEVAPLAPELAMVDASPVRANMLVHAEGASPIQTNVEVRIVNQGGSPTGPITVQLPVASWLSLATPNPMASIDPGQEGVLVLTLTPGRNLLNADPRYPGTVVLRSQAAPLTVPFEFTAVATATSTLIVRTEDESTFYKETPPDPFPPVRGAFVRVVRPDGSIVMASGLTDQNGEVRFDGLPEGDYYVEASADRHQPFRELVAVRGSEPVRVYPFLSFNAISYSWTVDPIQIEDRYRFTLEAVFETNVPFPVVEVLPRVIDLDDYADGQPHQIDFTVINRGLIRAQQVQLTVGDSSDWIITTLNGEIGNLSPGRSVTVPAIIQRRPPACPTCTAAAGCSPPVTRVRHVVQCRGEQVLEQGVAYRLEPCGSP